MKNIAILLTVVILAGCATKSPDSHKLTRREAQCLNRVQVLMYDSSPRTPLKTIDLYDETKPITKPNKQIAFLTCEGTAREEIDMTKGMIEKARLLGADAIVIMSPSLGSDFQMGHGGSRAVFRCKAVVYEQ
ncbi:MAG TPA: hypothetical protein VGI63_05515 [Verrucomicrobiae bacterium]|jgi:hypothetical protein